ncbi:SGNH/GDSL hydrolase family protein [Mycobacterium sp. BMJ-28]
MADTHFYRYVALGDSQSEGLWDTDDTGALIGFADRLAWLLDTHCPGIEYANLAVRGKRIRDVLEGQLPEAVAMKPDLITMCVGMNDVTRPGRKFDQALLDLDLLHDRLARTGATVVTTTFPNLARVLPAGRILVARVLRINDVIRAAADRHGFRLIDLYHADSMTDPQNWSADRVHGSTKGHLLFTAAAAEALGLPGSNHDWAHAESEVTEQSLGSRLYSQAMWTQNMLMPWIWRHLRGRSASIGGGPRHPRPVPVAARSDAR